VVESDADMNKTDVPLQKATFAGKRISLAQMRMGDTGKIVIIHGGGGLICKCDALGIRIGKKITKVSEQWMRGPVVLRQDNTQVALGFGMASRVLVELL